MLENIWVIPAITFASFWLILFFGKKLPFKGSEVGLFAVGLCLVLATVAGFQWINHKSVPIASEGKAVATAPAESGGHAAEAEVETMREPVDKTVTWFTIDGHDIEAGTHVDGFAIVML